MWKSASRTLKSTFQKGVLKSHTVLSSDALQNKELQGLVKFTPFLLQQCNRFYNFYKGSTGNFTDEKKDGPKEKKTSFLERFDSNIFDALKWSGVFALAYFTFLQYKLRVAFPLETFEDRALYRTPYYHNTLRYIVDLTQISPYNCVLPEVQSARSKSDGQQFKESAGKNLKSDQKPFDNLKKAHKKVLGAVNNFLGTQCMESGHHKEAFEYFMKSAEEEHAPGIFNLGICHEKGLGTGQDLEMAAEMYQRAADLGHATAMYNLGVFYAQGKGKLEADMDHARKLFKAAASVGQADAINALNLEKQTSVVPSEITFTAEDILMTRENTHNNLSFNTILSQSSSNSFKQCSDCDSEMRSHSHLFEIPFDKKETNSSLDSDSGVLDLSPHNESCDVLI